MMGVTYNIPDIGLLGLISVRPRFLPVFYTTNNLFVFQDSAVSFQA